MRTLNTNTNKCLTKQNMQEYRPTCLAYCTVSTMSCLQYCQHKVIAVMPSACASTEGMSLCCMFTQVSVETNITQGTIYTIHAQYWTLSLCQLKDWVNLMQSACLCLACPRHQVPLHVYDYKAMLCCQHSVVVISHEFPFYQVII